MRIIERYIFREVLQNWLGVTLVLLVILLSNSLATVLSRAAQGGFGGKVVMILVGLSAIQQLVVLIPVGLFMGIMLALGRLGHESELTAMQACGLSNRKVLKPVLWLAMLAAAILVWLSFEQAPNAARKAVELRSEALRKARFSSLEPGKFSTFSSNGGIVFYAESVDGQGVLHNVYAERDDGNGLEIWIAKRAIQQGIGEQQQTLLLYDGQRYQGTPGSSEFRIIDFAEGGIPVGLPSVAAAGTSMEMQNSVSLLGSEDMQHRAELQRRISSPLMVLVLSVLAVPLARLRPRQGRYAKVGYFILLYLFYSGLIVVAGNAMTNGQSPLWLGMWWVHGLGVLLAVWLWYSNGRASMLRFRM
jgi:lipopolysaccharide export system permease protein